MIHYICGSIATMYIAYFSEFYNVEDVGPILVAFEAFYCVFGSFMKGKKIFTLNTFEHALYWSGL